MKMMDEEKLTMEELEKMSEETLLIGRMSDELATRTSNLNEELFACVMFATFEKYCNAKHLDVVCIVRAFAGMTEIVHGMIVRAGEELKEERSKNND